MKVDLRNQIGYFSLISSADSEKQANSICVRSIVSSPLIDKIAAENNIEVVRTLTGFKYIGEIIATIQRKIKKISISLDTEGNGILVSPFICDKDEL